jgi:phage terminase Nu1 subunit (DNA packaging protein)
VAKAGTVKVGDLASFWNITPRRVQQLVAEEKMPTEGRGRYDLLKCTAWYIRFLQKKLETRSPNPALNGVDGADMAAERLRVLQADRALKEMELARRRGEVVEVDIAAAMWEKAVEKMRARMLASVSAGAVKWAAGTSRAEAHRLLVGIVHDALGEVAAIGDEVEAEG